MWLILNKIIRHINNFIYCVFYLLCIFCKDSFENESEHSLIIVGCAKDCNEYLPKVLNKK